MLNLQSNPSSFERYALASSRSCPCEPSAENSSGSYSRSPRATSVATRSNSADGASRISFLSLRIR